MSRHGRVRFPWHRQAETPAEPRALLQAALIRELALHDEQAARRLAAEAEGLRGKAGSAAAADALEQAARARAEEAERERASAEQIVNELAKQSEAETNATSGADGAEQPREEVIAALAGEAARLAAESVSGKLEEHVAALEQRLREELMARIEGRLGAALASYEAEVRKVSELAETRLAEYALALRQVGEARAQQAEARIAQSGDDLERLAGQLQARIHDADRRADRANAAAKESMRSAASSRASSAVSPRGRRA